MSRRYLQNGVKPVWFHIFFSPFVFGNVNVVNLPCACRYPVPCYNICSAMYGRRTPEGAGSRLRVGIHENRKIIVHLRFRACLRILGSTYAVHECILHECILEVCIRIQNLGITCSSERRWREHLNFLKVDHFHISY